jgi:glycosyltransferase involved in cell wall biosynthesis
MFFAEAEAVHVSGIWPLVRRLGLSERFTLAPDVEARRELALRGDALVLPEALGEHRTLTLDAMAAGMVVIAAADPLVSVLVDTRTARLVDKPSAERWAGALRWLAESRDPARALALAAREHVRAQCRASAHVAAVMDAYEWMTASESIPFGSEGERNVR